MSGKTGSSKGSVSELEALQNSESLKQLDNELRSFNPFSALRIVHHEIRHSAFLRWLLDPQESHGKQDEFLKEFLRFIDECTPSNHEKRLEISDLSEATVETEWNDIDLMIRDPGSDVVVALENKVHSREHDDQTVTSYERVVRVFGRSGWRRFIYLTPNSQDRPKSPHYHTLFLSELIDWLEEVLVEMSVEDKIEEFIWDFISAVRRNVLNQSKLAGEVVTNHRNAIEYIVKYREERRKHVSEIIRKCVDETEECGPLCHSRLKTRFLPAVMASSVRMLMSGAGMQKSPVFWEIQNSFRFSDRVEVKLFLDKDASKQVRTILFDAAHSKAGARVFQEGDTCLKKWTFLHNELWIQREEYYRMDDGAIENRIKERLTELMERSKKMSIVLRKAIEQG